MKSSLARFSAGGRSREAAPGNVGILFCLDKGTSSTSMTVSVTRTHLFVGLGMCWVERTNEKQTHSMAAATDRRPRSRFESRGCDSLQRLTRTSEACACCKS